MTTYKVKYEKKPDFPDGFYITILHKKDILSECRILKTGRNKDEITNAKLRYLSDFSKSHPGIIIKDVLKAFAKVDSVMNDLYKSQYKRGGYRGGGRPKGTNRTETLNQRLTKEEKEYLLNALKRLRATKNPTSDK